MARGVTTNRPRAAQLTYRVTAYKRIMKHLEVPGKSYNDWVAPSFLLLVLLVLFRGRILYFRGVLQWCHRPTESASEVQANQMGTLMWYLLKKKLGFQCASPAWL